MDISAIATMISIMIGMFAGTSLSVCSSKRAVGPSKIIMPEFKTHQISNFKTEAILIEHPTTVDGVIASRFRYTSHCYTGFLNSMDCKTELKDDFPTMSESFKWEKLGYCMIGDVCPSGGECYGNGAKKCKDENPRYTTKGRSSFMYKAIADRMSLWHTCTQDWKCDFKATKFPIHLQNEGGKIQ